MLSYVKHTAIISQVAVQNALFGDAWDFSALVVPGCVYTEPECAQVSVLAPFETSPSRVAL